jgi:hypothetical protein
VAQFQAKKVDRAGSLEVVQSLNQVAPHPVPEDRVRQLFDALWPELEKKVASIPKPSAAAKHTRPQPEILEELVASVRSLDSRFREIAEEGPQVFRHRWRRFHPMMVHELAHVLGEERGDPIVLLVVASMFRDDMPWLYELGMEAYRMAKRGTADEAIAARRRFQKAAELIRRGPFGPEEMGFDPHMMHAMVRELDHLLEPGPGPEPQPEPKPEASGAPAAKPRRKRGPRPE